MNLSRLLLPLLCLSSLSHAQEELVFEHGFEVGALFNRTAGRFDYTCAEFPTLLTGAAPQALTIELLVKQDREVGTILERRDGPPGCTTCPGFSLGYQNGANIAWSEGDFSANLPGFPSGAWHHFVIQRVEDQLFIWQDGNFEEEYSGLPEWGLVFPIGIPTYIGCDGDGSDFQDFFRGSLDELRISTTARFEPYTTIDTPCGYVADADTHALYKMEGVPTSTIKDSGGNGHDGFMVFGDNLTDVPFLQCP